MPPLSDIYQFFASQALGRTVLPSNVDLSGRTIIVTGANSGLGLDASKHLARMQVSCLVLACRDLSKGEVAKQAIYEETRCQDRTEVLVWKLDMDDYSSVRSFTKRVRQHGELKRVDAVIANAGVELSKFEKSEGIERTININVISTYLLCLGVLPRLSETANTFNVQTRITLVGSLIHYFGAHDQLHAVPAPEDVLDGLSDGRTAKMEARYPLSKLVEHLCFTEFVNDCEGDNVIVNLVNPGWCGTALSRNKHQPLSERFFFSILGRTSEEGSRTLVHGICAGRETHGKYLSECQVKRQSTYVNSIQGRQMGARLWKELMTRIEVQKS